MKKRPAFFEKISSGLKSRSFRLGGYGAVSLIVVLAIAVMANILVSALPSKWVQLDTTTSGLFTLSNQTENIVSSLTQDVTVYWVVQQGREDATIETLLNRYESLSDCLHIVKKDPDVYPTFAQQFTTERIYNNSLIVTTDARSSYISYNDLYESDYSNYYSTGSYDVNFTGESALTSAIRYVTDENLPILYTVTGHGETALSERFAGAVEKENIRVEELSLLTVDAIPEDAACLLINAPKNDISEEERDMLLAWLREGGKLILLTDPAEADAIRENLDALMAEYGMTEAPGILLETNRDHYAFGAPYYLLPELQYHSITTPLKENGYYVLLPVAHGILTDDTLRDSLTIEELLTTTSGSFSKLSGYAMESYDRAQEDISGPFAVAALVEEGDTAVLWISSASLLQDQANAQVAGGNQDFFLNCLHVLCQQEQAISIHAKSVSYEYLTIKSSTAARLSILVVFVIPAIVLSTGILIWVRRKRR